MNLIIIFLTGLTTGGLSCLAIQGGLLASVIANQKESEIATDRNRKLDRLDWQPVLAFLFAKIISHTLLGLLLGTLGSVISLSLTTRLFFQGFTSFFMIATAMNLLAVHPIFRYLTITPPKFIRKLVKNQTQTEYLFAPAILGFLTIFIPCGVTQAMEVLAISTGNPISGALIMFSFVLGTSPLFLILGTATARLSENWHNIFTKFAAIILILMSLYSLNGILLVLDSPLGITKNTFFKKENLPPGISIENGTQKVNIFIYNQGYSPNYIKVKKDVPVLLTLRSNNVYSCALSFVLNEFGINTFLKSTDQKSFQFTPTQKGKFTFTCSMGMYTGTLEVI